MTPWLRTSSRVGLARLSIWAASIIALLLAAQPALPQQALPPLSPIVCAYNSSPPTVTTGQMVYAQCNATGQLITSGSGGGPITGPLGPATAPTAAVSTVLPDGVTASASVTSAATIFTQDLTGYAGLSVQLTSIGSGNTITFTGSNDGTTFGAIQGGRCDNATAAETNAVTSGTLCFPSSYHFIRGAVTTYGSGTVTVVYTLKAFPVSPWAVSQGAAATVANSWPLYQVPYGSTQTAITAASGNVANASAVATLAGVSSKTTYITGLQISASGATVGACVSPTVTGTITGTLTFTFCAAAGALLADAPLIVPFSPPVPASAANTAIVVTLPALGAGNTNATVTAQGFQQ